MPVQRLLIVAFLAAGLVLAKTPEWDRAQAAFATADFKQTVAILEKAPRNDFDNALLLGRAYMELKRYGDAQGSFESATKLRPKSSEAQLWLGRAWGRMAEGNKLLAFGRARKAKTAFEQAVALDPKSLDALDDLFEYYFEAPSIVGGGLDKAERIAKQVQALDAAHGEDLLERVALERKK
jgi:cytochrome c-type biogenesis protein CcmH/NrfG